MTTRPAPRTAQAPAPPKWHRTALRAAPWLARLGFLTPNASERAALALRDAAPALRSAAEVVFLIPLVGRDAVQDWPGTVARLHATLAQFQRQTDPRWRAVICGQDAPDDLPDDPRIAWLPFTEEVDGNDKWAKLAALTAPGSAHLQTPAYAMTFDADDLASPDLVAEMLTRAAPGGYLVERGYVWNVGTGAVGAARPQSLTEPGAKAFWKLCGSCAALRIDPAAGPEGPALLQAMSAHEHRMFPHLAALAGQRLTPLRAASVVYLLNHGDNFGARRGRVGFKARYVDRFALSPSERAAFDAAFPGLIQSPTDGP
ncbi:hypothetical protein [Pseudaestuariivita atlantica]|uniref:Glycosyltransferase 2-like domain-containing protein n=1 Tax=Pseudaestuariivita atlantica TaxID=1317121 RepID=A0A0L1JMZ9_9RHOB|nr:hypothetical protein [Pseudaestuariivita atlantica]KNG93135.1 hypothetical protein ATO11_14640 [Pseudaestuariivita atlantica]